MNQHTLREVAKVGAGLVIADLVSVIWMNAVGLLPLTILGVTWTSTAVLPIVVFDSALLILLVHYGWNTSLPIKSPTEKWMLVIAGTIFLAVAILHLTRLAFGWAFILGEFVVPTWLSWVGVLLAMYMSQASFHFALRPRR